MLADLVREFCNKPEYNYEVYENYTKTRTTLIGESTITTIGIVVKEDGNVFEMLAQLTSFLDTKLPGFQEAKGGDDLILELEGVSVDEFGMDRIVYFPAIQNYHPL